MLRKRAIVFVCTSCRRRTGEDEGDAAVIEHPGPVLAERVRDLLADDSSIDVVPIDCLAVCNRPCTIAVTAANKWTYIVGDLDEQTQDIEVAAVVRAFAETDNGIVPWKERPTSFRKGVIARVPPLLYRMPDTNQSEASE